MRPFVSLKLFKKAYAATHNEISTSLLILAVTTFVFTIIMWLAERSVNDAYTLSDALVWVITKYVEDPADITTPPVTILGQVVGTLVGILGIAIFAVPAGLIGSGLLDAMGETKHEDKVNNNSERLHKRFRRIAQSSSWFFNESGRKETLKYVPRFRTMEHIIVKTGMNNDDIIEAVNNSPDMRLMNLAATKRNEEKAKDELVVTHFPLNREYGCVVDRASDVTIVAPVAVTELGTGSFAFSLAAMGGFNYVSKELTPNPDDPFGFYSMQKSKLSLIGDDDMKAQVEAQALHFIDDLEQLKARSIAEGRRHWFIFLLGTTKSIECQLHLWRLATDNDNRLAKIDVGVTKYGSTVVADDEPKLQSIYNTIKGQMSEHIVEVNGTTQPVAVCLDNNNLLKSVLSSNIMCRMGGGEDCNTLTMRMGYEILVYSNSHLLVAKDIAETIKSVIEPEREIPADAVKCFMEEGDSFADNYGECVVFERDTEKLQKMLEQCGKEALRKYKGRELK